MPDITMCNGEKCPKKVRCYRFKAIPSKFRQSFFVEAPYDKKTKACLEYWPMKKGVK